MIFMSKHDSFFKYSNLIYSFILKLHFYFKYVNNRPIYFLIIIIIIAVDKNIFAQCILYLIININLL